jgi:hypothetical protein
MLLCHNNCYLISGCLEMPIFRYAEQNTTFQNPLDDNLSTCTAESITKSWAVVWLRQLLACQHRGPGSIPG